MSSFTNCNVDQSQIGTSTDCEFKTLPVNGVFTEKYYEDYATNNLVSQESLNNQISELRKNYNHLQQWYNYTVSHNNELKKTIECRDAEIQYLYDEIARKNAEKIIEDEKKNEDWWKNVNLDRVELDAQIQLNKKYAEIIDKLKKRLNKNRKYSKKLLKRNRILSQSENTEYDNSLSHQESQEKCITQIFNKNNEYVFRNLCMSAVYGRIPSIALWNSTDVANFNSNYWLLWSEEEASKIIKMLQEEYKEFSDLKRFIDQNISMCRNDNIKNHNCLILKNIAQWLFSS